MSKIKKYCEGLDCAICDEKEPCIYKIANELQEQLQAKEQECEFSNLKIIQLQETLSQYETDLSTKDCIVETCKAQYKELKAELEQYKASKQASYEALQKKCNELELENRKLKQRIIEIDHSYKNRQEELEQTLIEIKKIAEDQKDVLESMRIDIAEQILNKINEVIKDEDV